MAAKVANRRKGDRRKTRRRRSDFWSCAVKTAAKVGAVIAALVFGYAEVQTSNDRFFANRELVQKAEAERAKREADERLRKLEEQLSRLSNRMPLPEPPPEPGKL